MGRKSLKLAKRGHSKWAKRSLTNGQGGNPQMEKEEPRMGVH